MKYVISVTLLSLFLQAEPWHSEITHRPRLMYISADENDIKSRLSIDPYNLLWYNNFSVSLERSIYTNASRQQAATQNTFESPREFTDLRSKIAKDAAFVYAMNKRANGVDDLYNYTDVDNPWTRDEYKDHAIDYLESLDPTVNGPTTLFDFIELAPYVNNWQHRAEELIYYCQAYDLLLGSGVPENSTMENNISNFANNLFNMYTEYTLVPEFIFRRNNHKLMFAAALGMAAVTLNNNSNADTWINAAMVIIEWVLFADPTTSIDGTNQIDADGGYAEGPNYMRYAWRKLIPFFVAMKNFNGNWTETYSNSNLDNFYPFQSFIGPINVTSPWYDTRYTPTYDWMTKIRTPEGRLPSIEDTPLKTYFPELAIFGGYYSWPYESYNSSIPKEKILSDHLGTLRADYICAGNAVEQNVPIDWGNVQYLPNAGSIVFRSDWSPDAIYLHLNGKNGNARQAGEAHDQADALNLTLGFKRKRLIIDGGYPGYNNRYSTNKAENHNVVLVNGWGPYPPSGPSIWIEGTTLRANFKPSLTDAYFRNLYTDDFCSYIELISNYGKSFIRVEENETIPGQEVWDINEDDNTNVDFTRSATFIDNNYFIILDDVNNQNDDEKQYIWQLHCNGGEDTGGQFQSTSNGGIISQGNANLLSFTTTIGYLDGITYDASQYDDSGPPADLRYHTVIKAEKNAIDTQFLSVLYPFEGSSPQVINFSSGEHAGLVVDRTSLGENRYEIILSQKSNSLLEIPEQTIGSLYIPSIQTYASVMSYL